MTDNEVLSISNYKKLQALIEDDFKKYKAFKVKLCNKMELEKIGISELYPYLGDPLKKTEKVKDQERKVKKIENILMLLDKDEQEFLKERYLNGHVKNDLQAMEKLGKNKTKYYALKKEVILKYAKALKLI